MLSDKDRELIGIGASIAAGCEPCANFHLRAAGIAGATDAETRQAVDDALRVRRHATEGMAQLASRHAGSPILDTDHPEKTLISELVSISAAYGVNSVPDLVIHLTAARSLGATKGQILSAIKTARAVRDTAERKVEEATGRAMQAESVAGDNCRSAAAETLSEPAVRPAADERSETKDCGPQCGCHSPIKNKNS